MTRDEELAEATARLESLDDAYDLGEVYHASDGSEIDAGEQLDYLCRDLRTLLAAAKAGRGEGWRPTHRHIKSGRDFKMIGLAMLETARPVDEATALIIYRDKHGDLWARPRLEFGDGRFVALPPAPTDGGG
jgi:hypothetical protein